MALSPKGKSALALILAKPSGDDEDDAAPASERGSEYSDATYKSLFRKVFPDGTPEQMDAFRELVMACQDEEH